MSARSKSGIKVEGVWTSHASNGGKAEKRARACITSEVAMGERSQNWSQLRLCAGGNRYYGCVYGAPESFEGVRHWLDRFHKVQRAVKIVGFDTEWAAPWWWAQDSIAVQQNERDRPDTFQLYCPEAGALVFSTRHACALDAELVEILTSPSVIKVGVNVRNDASLVSRTYGVPVRSIVDIDSGSKQSLEALVRSECPQEMHIVKKAADSAVRTSDWRSFPLSTAQVSYAARDAMLSYWVFAFRHGSPWQTSSIDVEGLDLEISDVCEVGQVKRKTSDETSVQVSGKHAHFFIMQRNRATLPPNLGAKAHPHGTRDALKGMVLVVSGVLDSFHRKDWDVYVRAHGAAVAKSMLSSVTHLVNDHGEIGPSKLAACKKRGIPILSEDDILEKIRRSSSKL